SAWLAASSRCIRAGGCECRAHVPCCGYIRLHVVDATKARAATSPPPLRGRDREGGSHKHRVCGYPPPHPSPARGGGAGRPRLASKNLRGDGEFHVIAALTHLARLTRAGFVFAREGVFGLVDPKPLPVAGRAALRLARLVEKPTTDAAPARLSSALTRLGPTYVKLGQFLATRPDVVGVAFARDLSTLQGRMAPVPPAAAGN